MLRTCIAKCREFVKEQGGYEGLVPVTDRLADSSDKRCVAVALLAALGGMMLARLEIEDVPYN